MRLILHVESWVTLWLFQDGLPLNPSKSDVIQFDSNQHHANISIQLETVIASHADVKPSDAV